MILRVNKKEIRELLKKLLDDEYLMIYYNDLDNGFDLTVRLDLEKIETEGMCKSDENN